MRNHILKLSLWKLLFHDTVRYDIIYDIKGAWDKNEITELHLTESDRI